eukprot:5135045-Alexandrium_andersonii.AAC.1
MSASLVGSEMCIRDRCVRARARECSWGRPADRSGPRKDNSLGVADRVGPSKGPHLRGQERSGLPNIVFVDVQMQ